MSNYNIVNNGYSHDDIFFSKASSNYLYTKSNEKFIDLALGSGALIFGHQNIDYSYMTSPVFLKNNQYIHKLSKHISSRIPVYLNNYIYSNSGTEATQRAIRLSRLCSKKKSIGFFEGGWHGMNEWTLAQSSTRFEGYNKLKVGVPEDVLNDSLMIPYNSELSFEVIKKNHSKLAAVIIEPIQGSNPQPNIEIFLKEIIKLCHSLDILVIFDEIITGFRAGYGGFAQLYNLTPDIVCLGKIIGGGFPLGLTVFSDEVHTIIKNDKEKKILSGGTFSANPFVAHFGYKYLKNLNKKKYISLEKLSKLYLNYFNDALRSKNIPFVFNGYHSIHRLYFTDKEIRSRKERDKFELPSTFQSLLGKKLFEKKIIWPGNGILMSSFSHNDKFYKNVINEITDTILEIL